MTDFDLETFLPFRLHQASEAISRSFRRVYLDAYGLTRSEWRVLAHLGQYGSLTATEIGRRAGLHKTKVSRAVFSLEDRRWLQRQTDRADRRIQHLALTRQGEKTYAHLGQLAQAHNQALIEWLGAAEAESALALFRVLESGHGARSSTPTG